MRLCSVSVDLDEIDCYARIHDLSALESHAVYDRALERLETFARDLRLPLTLFVIGRDLDRAENVTTLRRMVFAGHEIGN
ncbi:MAG TPA: polysaccharide deacetylase, partial [Polyangiaceae bacterium]